MTAGLRTLRPLLLAAALGLAACAPEPPPRHLVLLSLDTVRADHLTPYGYARPTSPALETFAAGSVLFTRAFAQQTNTNPSHASMFTGLYPHVHGNETNFHTLPEGRPTLAGILAQNGFATGGFVSGAALQTFTGLHRGFEVYRDEMEGWRQDGAVATERALEWLRSLPEDRRFFLFLHLYDAHGPYQVDPERLGRFASPEPGRRLDHIPPYQRLRRDGKLLEHLNLYVDRYDTQVHYMDELAGRLLAEIDLEDTLVVVATDHGETLGERYHVLDHGAQVFEEQTRIALLVRAPGLAPRRVDTLVESVDLLPTVLDLLGVPPPPGAAFQGSSLRPLLAGSRKPLRSVVFSSARADSTWYEGYELDDKRLIHTARSNRWKLIVYPGVERDYIELYDLRADPGETENVAGRHPEVQATLAQALERWLDERGPTRPEADLPEELREKLRQLGYVSSGRR
jgi:arylsulfatase A-like enzyme